MLLPLINEARLTSRTKLNQVAKLMAKAAVDMSEEMNYLDPCSLTLHGHPLRMLSNGRRAPLLTPSTGMP